MSGHSPRSLGEKALEEQLHADRVDGGDAERVAHRRVGRRAAPLRENALLAAEADDVPDDEEIAGEIEPGDDGELVLELAAHPRRQRRRSAARAPA